MIGIPFFTVPGVEGLTANLGSTWLVYEIGGERSCTGLVPKSVWSQPPADIHAADKERKVHCPVGGGSGKLNT